MRLNDREIAYLFKVYNGDDLLASDDEDGGARYSRDALRQIVKRTETALLDKGYIVLDGGRARMSQALDQMFLCATKAHTLIVLPLPNGKKSEFHISDTGTLNLKNVKGTFCVESEATLYESPDETLDAFLTQSGMNLYAAGPEPRVARCDGARFEALIDGSAKPASDEDAYLLKCYGIVSRHRGTLATSVSLTQKRRAEHRFACDKGIWFVTMLVVGDDVTFCCGETDKGETLRNLLLMRP